MKRVDKRELAQLVKDEIAKGSTMTEAVRKLAKLCFHPSTIRTYYKAFSK